MEFLPSTLEASTNDGPCSLHVQPCLKRSKSDSHPFPHSSNINFGSLRTLHNRLCAHNARAPIFLSKRERLREIERERQREIENRENTRCLVSCRLKNQIQLWLTVSQTGCVPGIWLWGSCLALEFWKWSQVRLMKQLCKRGVLSVASPSLACVFQKNKVCQLLCEKVIFERQWHLKIF